MQRLFGLAPKSTHVTLESEVAAHVRQNDDMEEIRQRIDRIHEELALRERRQHPRIKTT